MNRYYIYYLFILMIKILIITYLRKRMKYVYIIYVFKAIFLNLNLLYYMSTRLTNLINYLPFHSCSFQ